MKFTSESQRNEALLEAISNYRTLPLDKQAELRPFLEETIARHKELSKCSKVIDGYIARLGVKLEYEN